VSNVGNVNILCFSHFIVSYSAGNDASSPVYDYKLSYDLLPPITRTIVHPMLSKFYPRLHHANVEIR
jgi:hypothetical protein